MHGAPLCACARCRVWCSAPVSFSRRTQVGEGACFALTCCCCCSGDDYLLSGLSLINYCATYKYYRKSEKIYRYIRRLFKLLLVQINTKLRGSLVVVRKSEWSRPGGWGRGSSCSNNSNSGAAAEVVATAVAAAVASDQWVAALWRIVYIQLINSHYYLRHSFT